MSTILQHASTAWCLAETIFDGQVAPWSTPFAPILGDLVEMRADRVERQHHLRDRVLDLRVVGHGPADAPIEVFFFTAAQREVHRPLRDAVVDVARSPSAPRRTCATTYMSAPPAGRMRAMYLSGTKAPSSTMSSLRVARMPIVSQVSTMR